MKKKDKTPEPEVDVSLLTEEQKEEYLRKPNWRPWAIFFGVTIALMIVCVVVIAVL